MRRVLDLLLPPACCGCGRLGSLICDACVREFRAPGSSDAQFLAPDPGAVVGSAVTLVVSAFAYEGPMRRALSQLKYGGASRVAAPLADRAMPEYARLARIGQPDVIVPVPLHVDRRRERGYNQAALIGERIGRRSATPVVDMLLRTGRTERQHRLDRASRLRNLRHAFSSRMTEVPRVVIVVDDILTTSATIEACAEVLLANGATTVYGFTLAREV